MTGALASRFRAARTAGRDSASRPRAPFDRKRTTMVDFPPCPQCLGEYADPADRRFHAQNISCTQCGPRIHLERNGDPVLASSCGSSNPGSTDFPVLEQAVRLLREGQILAVKGVGGFHLICDATSEEAVRTLTDRKCRDRKPLAVLFQDLDQVMRACRGRRSGTQCPAQPRGTDPAAPAPGRFEAGGGHRSGPSNSRSLHRLHTPAPGLGADDGSSAGGDQRQRER